MATPKVGGHAYVREKAIPRYTGHYGHIAADEAFVVKHIDGARGRGCIYLVRPNEPDRMIPVWRGDVKPFPRCEYCDAEGHTKSRCKPEVAQTA